jgi:hypothetical protein
MRCPVSTSVVFVGPLMPGRGLGGNREVSPLLLRAGCAANLEGEGGPWGKQGFPCGTEWPAWTPDAEDA